MYSIFRYMPTTILTEEQKNYVLMLLAGGDLPQNEIRMFLARSGWSLDQIDAGVLYSQDESLQKMLSELRGEPVTPVVETAPTIVPAAAATTAAVQIPAATVSSTVTTPITSPKILGTDIYRESTTAATIDFKQAATTMPSMQGVANSTAAFSGMAMQKSPLDMAKKMGAVSTMPPAPKKSAALGALVFFAWLLFIVLIGLVAAIVGYMYYTGTGFFENISYTKLF